MGFNKDAINDIIPYAIIKGERVCNITNSIQMALVYLFFHINALSLYSLTHIQHSHKN